MEKELQTAIFLARKAGKVVLKHYQEGVQVEYKDVYQTDPVTQADRDANQIIVDGLLKVFPNDAILAEESKDDLSRLKKDRLWCIDPIDGTREFIAKNDMFIVMIGLAVKGRSCLGVMYHPTTERLWYADGKKARMIDKEGKEHILKPSLVFNSKDAKLMVSRSHRSKYIIKYAQDLGVSKMIPMGSVGLKVACIAEGHADIYASISNLTKEWDVCAPEAIVRTSGGCMTDINGDSLVYNKENISTPFGFLATNNILHKKSVSVLKSMIKKHD